MKSLILLFGLLLFIGNSGFNANSDVYVCKGKYAKKYHFDKDCRGLSNCKAAIVSMELQEAKDLGRTLCGWER